MAIGIFNLPVGGISSGSLAGTVDTWKVNSTTNEILEWIVLDAAGNRTGAVITNWQMSSDGMYIKDLATGKMYRIRGKLTSADCPCREEQTTAQMWLTAKQATQDDVPVNVIKKTIVCQPQPTRITVPCDETNKPAAGVQGLGTVDYLAEEQTPAGATPPILPTVQAGGWAAGSVSVSTQPEEESKMEWWHWALIAAAVLGFLYMLGTTARAARRRRAVKAAA